MSEFKSYKITVEICSGKDGFFLTVIYNSGIEGYSDIIKKADAFADSMKGTLVSIEEVFEGGE